MSCLHKINRFANLYSSEKIYVNIMIFFGHPCPMDNVTGRFRRDNVLLKGWEEVSGGG